MVRFLIKLNDILQIYHEDSRRTTLFFLLPWFFRGLHALNCELGVVPYLAAASFVLKIHLVYPFRQILEHLFYIEAVFSGDNKMPCVMLFRELLNLVIIDFSTRF